MKQEKDKLFIDFIKNNTVHKDKADLIFIKDDYVFILSPEDKRYSVPYREFINEIKMYLTMFGFSKLYECKDITDNTINNNIMYMSSGVTSFFNG